MPFYSLKTYQLIIVLFFLLQHISYTCESMNSRNPYSNFYERMLYFHGTHHEALISMEQQCKQAKTIRDLHRLAYNIESFCQGLHGHHTIEDYRIFPRIAQKTDISHLHAHHEQLSALLNEFEKFSYQLRAIKSQGEEFNVAIDDATSLISRVSKLVNEHERAEEKVIAPDNMKKWFTETEMRDYFHA